MPESTPFDLDLRVEADKIETITIQAPDGSFAVPASMDDWKGNAVNLIADGRFREAMEVTCLDLVRSEAVRAEKPKQEADAEVDRVQAIINELSVGDIGKIIDHVSRTGGVSAGESSGSATTSRSTGTRSKRTS